MVKGELQSALADRYTIERELSRGGMATSPGSWASRYGSHHRLEGQLRRRVLARCGSVDGRSRVVGTRPAAHRPGRSGIARVNNPEQKWKHLAPCDFNSTKILNLWKKLSHGRFASITQMRGRPTRSPALGKSVGNIAAGSIYSSY